MESLRETIRKNIEMYIKTSQYNQVEIAQMLGISKASVTNWIKGTNSPNIEYLDKLCDIFNIQINDIFERHENRETENLTTDEVKLLNNYKQLNQEGKEKALDYVNDLTENPKYKKCDMPKLVQEA